MKKILALCLCLLLLTGCGQERVAAPTEGPTELTFPLEAEEPATEPGETEPPQTLPPETRIAFGYEDISADEAVEAFREVCLAAEYPGEGVDYTILHKWSEPIVYRLYGAYTPEDVKTLETFCAWLNDLEGFPGIREAEEPELENLSFHFCDQAKLDDFSAGQSGETGCEGYVTVWYDEKNISVSSGTIYLLSELPQERRDPVLLEEVYNALGPLQDTTTRPDSIIYQFPQEESLTWLSPMDELLLKLLYYPDMTPGLPGDEAEDLIRSLLEEA